MLIHLVFLRLVSLDRPQDVTDFPRCEADNHNAVLEKHTANVVKELKIQEKLDASEHSINLGHNTRLHGTTILARQSRCTNQIIRDATDTELHTNNANTKMFISEQVMEASHSHPDETKECSFEGQETLSTFTLPFLY
jgi:hypothetical protein